MQGDSGSVDHRTNDGSGRAHALRRIKEHREPVCRNETRQEAQQVVQPRRQLDAIRGSNRPTEGRRDRPDRDAGGRHEHRNVHEAPDASLEVLSDQVDQSCHKREARHQEEQCGNKTSLVGRFDAEELLSWSHQQDIDHRSKSTACHPHAEVVHVANQHLTTQRLPKERGHRHGGALDPSPTVEESERRTGQTRCERVREPVVQARNLRDPVELVGNVFNANRLTVQRRDVVVDAVDLVRVDAHEALFRQLRAEGPVRVGGRDDFRIRDLCAMLGDTDGARDVRHGLFHAIRTRAEGQQHLSETQDYLGLMGEAVVRRHALGEYLVAPPVAVRPSRM